MFKTIQNFIDKVWQLFMMNIHPDDSFPVERKALCNPMLVSKVLRYLEPSNLRTCRQLNSTFRQLSDEILIDQKSLQLSLHHNQLNNNYHVAGSRTSLSVINEYLEKSTGFFPCTNLSIKGRLLMTDHLRTFLSTFGHKIIGFEWTASQENFHYPTPNFITLPELTTLRRILYDYAPNIETLHFENIRSWNLLHHQNVSIKSIQLPRLKSLKITDRLPEEFPLFKQILRAGINLEEFLHGVSTSKYLGFDVAAVLVQTKKQNLVKEILDCVTPQKLGLCQFISSATEPIRLEKLRLCSSNDLKNSECSSRMAKPLSDLFLSSSSTMKQLTLDFRLCELLPLLVIPPLPKLTELDFRWNPSDQTEMWPRNCVPSISFPSLNRLTLALSHLRGFEGPFPFMERMVNVKYLEIFYLPHPDWLIQFSQVFPNLKGLAVQQIQNFSKIGENIWTHFRGIEILQLDLDFGDDSDSLHPFPQLDSTFTGFDEETCWRLRDEEDESGLRMNSEEMRIRPSILDLTKLTELVITFWLIDRSGPLTTEGPLTRITGEFAFALMPQLKVKILGNDYTDTNFLTATSSLVPFVDIIFVD